jgi:hypothetical protein
MLQVIIEPGQAEALTQSLRADLLELAKAPSLDAAELALRSICTACFWVVSRGGHHVALNYQPTYGSAWRVAMVVEVRS